MGSFGTALTNNDRFCVCSPVVVFSAVVIDEDRVLLIRRVRGWEISHDLLWD